MGFEFTVGRQPDREDPALVALWNSRRQAYGVAPLDARRGIFDPSGVARLAERTQRRQFGAAGLRAAALLFKVMGLLTANPILKGIGIALGKGSERVAEDAANVAAGIDQTDLAASITHEFMACAAVMLEISGGPNGKKILTPGGIEIAQRDKHGRKLGFGWRPEDVGLGHVDSALFNGIYRPSWYSRDVRETFGLGDDEIEQALWVGYGKALYMLTGMPSQWFGGDVNHPAQFDRQGNPLKGYVGIISSTIQERWDACTRKPLTAEDKALLAGQSRKFECLHALQPPALAAARSRFADWDTLYEAETLRSNVAAHDRAIEVARIQAERARDDARAEEALRLAVIREEAAASAPTVEQLRASIGNPSEAFAGAGDPLPNVMPAPPQLPVRPTATVQLDGPPVLEPPADVTPPQPPAGPQPPDLTITSPPGGFEMPVLGV